jgi:hypothetical protein
MQKFKNALVRKLMSLAYRIDEDRSFEISERLNFDISARRYFGKEMLKAQLDQAMSSLTRGMESEA